MKLGKEVYGMDINQISPYIRIATDSVIFSPWRLHERVIFDFELLYIKEGNIHVDIEGKSFYGNPGDVFLFKPKQRHSIDILGDSCFHQPHIHFDLFYQPDSPEVKVSFKSLEALTSLEMKMFRESMPQNSEIDLPNQMRLSNTKLFEEMLFEIIKEYEMKMPFHEIIVKGMFVKLWTYLMRENYWHNNPVVSENMAELIGVKDYLYYNADREVDLDELSSEFNFSKYHLIRLFKKAFTVSPIHYHRLIRVEKAKKMIQFTNMSFTAISELLGFSSINSFSRAFRKVEGVPPSFYR